MKKYLLSTLVFLMFIATMRAQTPALGVTATIIAPTACTPPCNGIATAIVTGGTLPYTYLWNIPLAPQMTQTATGLCPGTYQLAVFDAATPLPNQGQAMITITCNTANGIGAIAMGHDLIVYPNPAFNELIVETASLQPGSAEFLVRDVLGNAVSGGIMEIGTNVSGKLNISTLPSGVYMIEILDKGAAIRTKFIKE